MTTLARKRFAPAPTGQFEACFHPVWRTDAGTKLA